MTAHRAFRVLAVWAASSWLLTSAWLVRLDASERLSDFAAFYAAGRLVGSGQLYDAQELQRVERESTGLHSPAHGFVRSPFQAVLFWPLAQLPYRAAEAVWAALNLLALGGFVCFWPGLALSRRWILACISLPAMIGLANGQDSAVILFAVTAAAALYDGKHPIAAGMVFSLCAAKAHLFLLLPLLVIRRREYHFGVGLLGGGVVLAAISTLAAGWQWPMEMWRAATHPAFTPDPWLMPNLAGALYEVPGAGWIYAFVAGVLAVVTWTSISRTRVPFHTALAVTIAASLPLAPHSYLPDCVLLLPAICEAIRNERPQVKLAGYVIATPLPFIAVFLDRPVSSFTAVAIVIFAGLTTRTLPSAQDPRQSKALEQPDLERPPECRAQRGR